MLRPALCLLLSVCLSVALDNGLARTPQMGWSSWNFFGCNINETIIREIADAIVSSGLSTFGYSYVNIDDCWAYARSANGTIEPDPTTFPSGMENLADYVHSQGLRFGVYSDSGNKTCAGRPGSNGYEVIDADTYARWGVDYLKYDNCNTEHNHPPFRERYGAMSTALNESGRHIFFSMCDGQDLPALWATPVGNSWRTTVDISDDWHSMLSNLDINNVFHGVAAPGGWNDPDMLEVGNGGMSTTEYISHFSLWALIKAPLIIGCDVRVIDNTSLMILTNTEVIDVNQDPLGVQGQLVKEYFFDTAAPEVNFTFPLQVWSAPLSEGNVGVVFFNREDDTHKIEVDWHDIGLKVSQTMNVRDLWTHSDLPPATGILNFSVPSHGVVMVRLSPSTLQEDVNDDAPDNAVSLTETVRILPL